MSRSLLSRSFHSLKWSTFSTAINVFFQFFFMAVMARLLQPSDFGLMAMANITMRFVSYFVEMGVGPALVQKPEISDVDITISFSISLVLGSIFYALMWLLAPVAALFFQNGEIVNLLRVTGLAFILTGFTTVSLHLMRRGLRFKELAIIEIASYVIGYGACGIFLAFKGFGVWSLVLAFLGQMFVTLVLAHYFVRHALMLRMDWSRVKHIFSFGSRYSVIGFLEFVGANLDTIFIGRVLGDSIVGIYNRALTLTNLPIQYIVNSLTKVLFPVLSEIQNDKKKVAQAYVLSLFLVGSFVSAVCFGMVPAARDIVLTLLGPKWMDAIPVVQILALAVPCAFLSHIHGVIFDSQAALGIKFKIQASTVIFLALMIYMLFGFGMLGIASAVALTEVFRFVCFLIAMRTLLTVPLADLSRISISIALIFVTTTSALWITVFGLDQMNWPAPIRLMIEMLVGALSLFFIFSVVWGRLGGIEAFHTLENRLPLLQRINRFGRILYKTAP